MRRRPVLLLTLLLCACATARIPRVEQLSLDEKVGLMFVYAAHGTFMSSFALGEKPPGEESLREEWRREAEAHHQRVARGHAPDRGGRLDAHSSQGRRSCLTRTITFLHELGHILNGDHLTYRFVRSVLMPISGGSKRT